MRAIKFTLRRSEVTISSLLKTAGYATLMSGKWHCNSKFNSPDQPQPCDVEFEHWFAIQNNAAPSHANSKNYVRNGKEVGPLEGYSCQLAMDEALNGMELRSQSPNAGMREQLFSIVWQQSVYSLQCRLR